MNRPILVIAIGYIIGIIWGIYLKISILPFYFLLISIYIIINLKYKKKKFKILSIKRYFRYIQLIFKLNIMYAISFDLTIGEVKKNYGEPYNNAYFEIRMLLKNVVLNGHKVVSTYP